MLGQSGANTFMVVLFVCLALGALVDAILSVFMGGFSGLTHLIAAAVGFVAFIVFAILSAFSR